MKYWITTQWPHLRSVPRDRPHRGVRVPRGKGDAIAPMQPGDLVWIYESKSGRPVRREKANGEAVLVRRQDGRGGVVALAEAVAAPEKDLESVEEVYADGTRIHWLWRAKTRLVNSRGFVARKDLNQLMGFRPGYTFRGFGTHRSGLREIGEDLHTRIRNAFTSSHAPEDKNRLRRGRTGLRDGKGGEGPVHKALKELIAADPSAVLGVPGIELVQIEYPFGATGDRVDVLLRDQNGRYLVVEVEPECPFAHEAGPLQCMKYRALLAYQLDRELEEILMYLVAHHIHDEVREKANRYDIRSVQVSPVAGG